MIPADVCAVVVTYQPAPIVLAHLATLAPQVGGIVVVDNGSRAEVLAALRAAAPQTGFTVIESGCNLGIAAALNIGVRWAKAQSFAAVALFDQDSAVTPGFMESMTATYRHHAQQERLAIVTPKQVERASGVRRVHPLAADGGPLVTITSGSLMPAAIFDECGWFREEFIIDCVDHEYCLRARRLGYTLAESADATLLVSVGADAVHRFLGTTIRSRHYSARRRYYLTRNRLVMIRRFWKDHPAWCRRMAQDLVGDALKVLLVEDERWSKTVHARRGFVDALRGRMGKVVDL